MRLERKAEDDTQELYPEKKGLKQGSDMTKFVFQKDHGGFNVEKGGRETSKKAIPVTQKRDNAMKAERNG